MKPKHILPFQVRVDLRVMAMKGYLIFPKALGLEPHDQMLSSVISRILVDEGEEVLPLSKGAVSVFYSPS